jgi:DNA polymerase-3 subunit epsilon
LPKRLVISAFIFSNLSFAIVDIETTGSYAGANGITEIAIYLHNGIDCEGSYETLINPGIPIPRFISSLTGITDEMVKDAPRFEDVAENIFNLLNGRTFVAHNVNFDYSFIRHHLLTAGYNLDSRKLCTVRLSRKVFPGFLKYGLGSICRELQIEIKARHRAAGDAEATMHLFTRIIGADVNGHIKAMLKGNSKEQYLPLHLPGEQIDRLPKGPGVYYFHDNKNKIIYVGKARNLQQRVKSHFSNNDKSSRKQEFMRKIYSVSFQSCGSELMALILESTEIRKLWPMYNRSQKRFEYNYGLYCFEDRSGFMRLGVEKRKSNLEPLYTFSHLQEGYAVIRRLIREFQLDEALCYIAKERQNLSEESSSYNDRVKAAVATLQKGLPTFVVFTDGIGVEEQACILIEQGRFYGMGYLPLDAPISDLETLKESLTRYPDNDYVRGLIYQFAEKNPHAKKLITGFNVSVSSTDIYTEEEYSVHRADV